MQPSSGARRLVRVRITTIVAVLAVAFGTSACVLFMPTPEPQPVWGSDPVRVESVTLAEDGRSVRLEFIGAAEFDANDPCTLAYEATAEIEGDVLQIAVVPQAHPKPLAEGTACDAMGYPRQIDVALDGQFAGNRVHDLAGYDLVLESEEE
jgi:hypothetical protein